MTEDQTGEQKPKDVSLAIRREMRVGWFAVRQLFATVVKVMTSTIVGSMAGRRELLAALDRRSATDALFDHDYSDRQELWLDYIADTGDGFDAAHSIAWLAGRDALLLDPHGQPTEQKIPLKNPEEQPVAATETALVLPAGEVLILGGDQVYPTASGEAYQGRLVDPFQSGRFYQPGGREVYAIPGNHDWYDGLSAFIALFCQTRKRWIGAWKTQQKRSYFAIKLPHGWWLWGADMALEDDLDPPQMDYFKQQASILGKGDRVILCIPSPTWIKREGHQAAARKGDTGDRGVEREIARYDVFSNIIADSGATIRLRLSGDFHHYTRHASPERDYVVSGGGGAFATGTGRTPKLLSAASKPASLKAQFPSKADSDRRRWSALKFAMLSPGFTFGLMLVQLLLCYAFNLGSRLNPSSIGPDKGWIEMLRATPADLGAVAAIATYVFGFIENAPITLLLLLITLAGFVGFANSGSPETTASSLARACGFLHWLLQMLLGISTAFFAAKMAVAPGVLSNLLFVSIDAVCLFAFGGLLFGFYLIVTNILFGLHEQEVFSCQSIEDYKCFLRIHIDRETLTIYPIGIDRVSKAWKPAPGVVVRASTTSADFSMTETVVVPGHASRIYDPVEPLRPKLIEPPVRIQHG
jgi:hypothetical protein